MTTKIKIIDRLLIEEAEKLSAEWNNTGFIVLNADGTLSATVWNHYNGRKKKEKKGLLLLT